MFKKFSRAGKSLSLVVTMIVVALLLVVVVAPKAKAQTASLSQWVANPDALGDTQDKMRFYPVEPQSFDDVTTTDSTASTSAVALTAAAGRKLLSVYVNGTGDLWMKLGSTTTTVSTGIKITDRMEDIPVNANVPISFIASTSFSYTTVEYRQRQSSR